MLSIKENTPLANLTSFGLGGNASFFAEINTREELKEAFRFIREKKIDFYVLGGGTNVLVSDTGFAGMIIKMNMGEIKVIGDVLDVEAGSSLIKTIGAAASAGLSGLEPLAGIPGTIGGATRGNAGAFGLEIGSKVSSVEVFNCEKNETSTFKKDDCKFEYRSSVFKNNKNTIILSVRFKLDSGNPEELQKKVKETLMKRAKNGLNEFKSAGSYFMNPTVDNKKMLEDFARDNGEPSKNGKIPAGWIIDQAGLRGKKIGGAQVSEKHANYIVNTGQATPEDVIMLVSYVKHQVRDQFAVQLQEEINYVGF